MIDGVTPERRPYNPGQSFAVRSVDVSAALAHADALAKGAVRFTRLEGSHFVGGAFWFDDTQGGEARRGQIYRLIPGPETWSAPTRSSSSSNRRTQTCSTCLTT